MLKILALIVKIAPLLAAIGSVVITTFTLLLIRTRIKNRNVSKTLKLFRELKNEQQQLTFILTHSKDHQYQKIACLNYLDNQENILQLINDGKIDQSLFDDLIKPQIIEFINTDIMTLYISEIQTLIRNKKIAGNTYKYLMKLIHEYNKKMNK